MDLSGIRVYVGLPNYAETQDRRVCVNRYRLFHHWDVMGLHWNFETSGRIFIHFARTEFASNAIEGGYTHLLMMDDDATVPVDFLEKLLAHDVDIVGLPYVHRGVPDRVCAKRSDSIHDPDSFVPLMDEDLEQGLVPVADIGTHCILIKTDVFTRPGIPSHQEGVRFTHLDDRASFAQEHNAGTPLFVMPRQGTEDTYFCYRARRKGFGVYCDTDQFSGHLGEVPVLGRECVGKRRIEVSEVA